MVEPPLQQATNEAAPAPMALFIAAQGSGRKKGLARFAKTARLVDRRAHGLALETARPEHSIQRGIPT